MENYILLTGGTGFIGSHLAERLLEEGNNLIILKRSFSDTWRIDHLIKEYPNERLILFNVDGEDLMDIFKNFNIEGIFHLAAAYIKNPSHEDIMTTIRTNIEFPTELLNLAVNNYVKYFINSGTFFEYSLKNLPLTEDSEIDSLNFYSTSKIAFEDILKYYCKEYDISCATLKLYTPYGPRDDENKIIPYLILSSLRGEDVNINNPHNRLDIVHVYDIIDAYLKLKNNILDLEKYESFNVARDINYSIDELYSSIKFNLGLEEERDLKEKEIPMFSDPSKIKKFLGWEPKININKGIEITINYYKERYHL